MSTWLVVGNLPPPSSGLIVAPLFLPLKVGLNSLALLPSDPMYEDWDCGWDAIEWMLVFD